MKIGPVDIRNHTFSRKMRGVDEDEVRDYLELVAERLEESVLEGEELRGRIAQLESDLSELRALERSMRDSLLSAERLVDDRSAQAEKEAQIVIKNAEVQADKLLVRAREDLTRLRTELDDLRRQRITYAERFRALLESQMRILEASLQSFDPEGSRPAALHASSPRPQPAGGPEHRYHPPPPEAAPPPASAAPPPRPAEPRAPAAPWAPPQQGSEGELFASERPAGPGGGAYG
jgi:cell division initiation protein